MIFPSFCIYVVQKRTFLIIVKQGLMGFDAEGVIGLSSPYKGTAERSSASKKPHIKNEETRRFSRRVSTFCCVFKISTEFELPFGCGFCSAQSRQPAIIFFSRHSCTRGKHSEQSVRNRRFVCRFQLQAYRSRNEV